MTPQKKENTAISTEQRIGRRLKAIRILRGFSQKALADACSYSNTTVCNIERGGDCKLSTLREIEKVLKCTLILVPNEDLI